MKEGGSEGNSEESFEEMSAKEDFKTKEINLDKLIEEFSGKKNKDWKSTDRQK